MFVLVVVGLSALLLMVVFRSVLIPLKAALLNLLSIAAALGVITLVFQEGWFGAQPGPIEAFIPVMIFAIVFGLSMDYEVFLSRGSTRSGSAPGTPRRRTGGAGRDRQGHHGGRAIMIVVFAAFILSPSRMLQQFGLGLAVAILLDAVVIRCLIVPAVMRLLGGAPGGSRARWRGACRASPWSARTDRRGAPPPRGRAALVLRDGGRPRARGVCRRPGGSAPGGWAAPRSGGRG